MHPDLTPPASSADNRDPKRSGACEPDATDLVKQPHSRRSFLSTFGAAYAAASALGVAGLVSSKRAMASAPTVLAGSPAALPPPPPGTFEPLLRSTLRRRRSDASRLRRKRALLWAKRPADAPLANDDELLYPEGWANFSKGLPHGAEGHPDPAAFQSLARACTSGSPEDFAAIPIGGTQRLRNPQGALSYEYCGIDSNRTLVATAPAFASAWRAAEMAEVYWAALLRDVPFAEYATDPLVAQACADLSALSDYRGPREGGLVTPGTIFRGPYAGCTAGPFVSQFLLKDIEFGAQLNTQQVRTFVPGVDYLTNFQDWLARQNGAAYLPRQYDPVRRYLRNARDLAAWVDADPPLQAGYHALSILKQIAAALDSANPYQSEIQNQDAFTTFGVVEWLDMIGRAPRPAHEAAWFQKWRVHRTLRPEEYAARVHNHRTGVRSYPVHDEMLNSAVLQEIFQRFGTYLCPQAYPDGAPLHPAYPSGHSVGSGSTTTMLKAIFDEDFVIPNPVEPTADGLALQPYVGPPLTVGAELNKLAFNIGMARIQAGIHWRSDVIAGNRLGEETSFCILQDVKATYSERFSGYSFTRFDGTSVVT